MLVRLGERQRDSVEDVVLAGGYLAWTTADGELFREHLDDHRTPADHVDPPEMDHGLAARVARSAAGRLATRRSISAWEGFDRCVRSAWYSGSFLGGSSRSTAKT